MSTKLKIDLSQGLLEVEGSEAFVKSIYADFKTHFAGIEISEDEKPKRRRSRKIKAEAKTLTPASTEPADDKPKNELPATPQTGPTALETAVFPVTKKGTPASSPYTYLADLDLGAAKNHSSLVDFMDSKLPITNEEHNIVFLYYLQYLLKLKPITIDHLYTCYRAARIRVPLNIEKTLNQRGWVKMTQNGTMTLSATGKKHVEQNMPRKLKG